MARIFISYRREDTSGYTGRLADDLREHFGRDQIFMDLEAIEPGADFVDAIDEAVDSCAALLVVIGRDWLTIAGPEGRPRLEDDHDFVRVEVSAALERKARVIPVLVNGAGMPSVEVLPESLSKLARRQAHELGDGKRWMTDVAELIRTLERIPGLKRATGTVTSAHEIVRRESQAREPARQAPQKESKSRLGRFGKVAVGLVGLMLLIGLFAQDGEDDWEPGNVPPGIVVTTPASAIDVAAAVTDGYSSEVQRVQGMLVQLGYDPGPADGLLGPSTTYAIRDFQDSNGYRVDGRITPGLMRQLEDEVQDVTAWAAPPAAQPSARPMARPSVDISGTWYDDQGNPLQIQQNGGTLQIYAVNPLLGTPYLIAEGGIQGGTIAVNYRNSAGVSGSVRGDLAPDGRHINGTDVESTTGYTVTSTWHRGHLPGR